MTASSPTLTLFRPLAEARYRLSSNIKAALNDTGTYLPLLESHQRCGKKLAASMNAVLPELAPFSCVVGHLLDGKSLEGALQSVIE